MLIPLHQFICDTCGGAFNARDGWLEWLHQKNKTPRKYYGWRICCHAETCQRYRNDGGVSDAHLAAYSGTNGAAFALSFLGFGYPSMNGSDLACQIAEGAEATFIDMARRLTVPHYEEARLFFLDARENDDWDGYDEFCQMEQ